MRCERARDLISPYLDDELRGDDRQVLATHLRGCAGCARLALDLRGAARALAEGGRSPLPEALAPRLRAGLAGARAAPARRPRWSARSCATGGLAWRASLLLAVCALTACATWWLRTLSEAQTRLEHDVLAAHIRSLLQASPIEVASADSHAVKPWFNGRLEFSPSVLDLSGVGFELMGGRLDYVGDRRVGVVVYKRHRNTLNVFVWPDDRREARGPRLAVRKGYSLVSWTDRGLAYWAISDLGLGELEQIPGLL